MLCDGLVGKPPSPPPCRVGSAFEVAKERFASRPAHPGGCPCRVWQGRTLSRGSGLLRVAVMGRGAPRSRQPCARPGSAGSPARLPPACGSGSRRTGSPSPRPPAAPPPAHCQRTLDKLYQGVAPRPRRSCGAESRLHLSPGCSVQARVRALCALTTEPWSCRFDRYLCRAVQNLAQAPQAQTVEGVSGEPCLDICNGTSAGKAALAGAD